VSSNYKWKQNRSITTVVSSAFDVSCCTSLFTYSNRVPSCCSIRTWLVASTEGASSDVPGTTCH